MTCHCCRAPKGIGRARALLFSSFYACTKEVFIITMRKLLHCNCANEHALLAYPATQTRNRPSKGFCLPHLFFWRQHLVLQAALKGMTHVKQSTAWFCHTVMGPFHRLCPCKALSALCCWSDGSELGCVLWQVAVSKWQVFLLGFQVCPVTTSLK